MKFSIGQSAPRIEDHRLLTGTGSFTDDLTDPAALRAVILRSDHAHAIIKDIDTTAAAAADGVVSVLTERELAQDGIKDMPCLTELDNRDGSKQAYTPWAALARDRVRFVGQPVVLIIAKTVSQATDAAELIAITYEDLPVSLDLEKTVKQNAPQLWDHIPDNTALDWHIGDEAAVDDAFAKAASTSSIRLVNNRVVVNSMEVRPIFAQYNKSNDRTTLYSSTQGPDFIIGPLAQVLSVDKSKLRCVTNDVGGGFGMKVFLYPEHVLVTWAARKLKCDISYLPTRSEAFTSDVHGRDLVSHAQAALDENGVILGLKVLTYSNLGACLSNFGPYIQTGSGGHMIPGCYQMPACYNRVIGVLTNTVPVDAYRGAGRPEATYLIERFMDVIADDMGLSPDEIRRRNFIKPEQMPYTTALGNTYDSGDFEAIMQLAMENAQWDQFDTRAKISRDNGKIRGIGMSVYIERCGGGGGLPAVLEFNEDDSLTLLTGTQTNGQGHETAFTQILSDRLGISVEKIHIVQGDTDRTPPGFTGGSRSVPIGGSATLRAADEVIQKGRSIAAHLLETAESDIEYTDGRFTVAGTDMTMDLFQVASAAQDATKLPDGIEPGLNTTHEFTSDEATYPNGCHICELEIDPETGEIEIANYTLVDDFGELINPNLLAGQVHGGIAQGIGQALLESTVYDANGQLVSGSFMDYTMPRADNIPPIRFNTKNIPCKNNPLGIKGAGEAGAIGSPPAVVNAVVNAVAQYAGDINHIDMPITREAVWQLLQK